ncbi:MAG: tyrosine-type recombinase/integrase [Phycisphaerales bacterium]|nr:MAG: tyrosine-type recombinase/integrase [Phycisphaerales bacterium]
MAVYQQDGQQKTKLSPHRFRHSNAADLLDTCDNTVVVKEDLGHTKTETTEIYSRSLTSKR